MVQDNPTSSVQQAPIPEYHKIEILEIYQRTRELSVLRVQVATFFGTANLTLLGLAFSTQLAGLMLFGAGLLILWWIADAYAIRELKPFYFRGLKLERTYSPDWQDSLLRTYLGVSKARSDWVESLSQIAELDSRDEQIRQLRRLKLSVVGLYRAVAILLVAEVVGALVLPPLLGWSLF